MIISTSSNALCNQSSGSITFSNLSSVDHWELYGDGVYLLSDAGSSYTVFNLAAGVHDYVIWSYDANWENPCCRDFTTTITEDCEEQNCPNLLINGDLETGNSSPWTFWEPTGSVTIDSANPQEGAFAIKQTGGVASAEYQIGGLSANTEYVFSGYALRSVPSDDVVFGVKNHGAAVVSAPVDSVGYKLISINFTTGASSTSATLFFYSEILTGVTYGDNFSLEAVTCETSAELPQGTYYVDATGGNDANDGLSPATAWQSLSKVNASSFSPGSTILLKCGEVWNEQLKPTVSGTAGNINVIDSYGSCPDNASKPHIAADGQFHIPVHFYNVAYWEINSLQVSNDTPDNSEYTGAHGILLEINNFGTADHLYVRDCYIHDIDGNNVKGSRSSNGYREGNGIMWKNTGGIISVFNDLVIENNVLERVDRNGIKGEGYWERTNWHPSTNLIIRGNELTDIGGDGIVVIATDGALVEYNTLKYFRMRPPLTQRDCSAGIWAWSADNTLFQYNESAFGWGKDTWGCDAQGFDADANCINTTFQYNYSHDNDGGFTLVINYEEDAPSSTKLINTVYRYNISVNDGAYKKRLIQMTGAYDECYFYNNVFYMGEGTDIEVLLMETWPDGYPLHTGFYNNIFYLANGATATYSSAGMGGVEFGNNIFYGPGHNNLSQIVAAPITSDPQFVLPGPGADIDDLAGFMLQPNSPAIDAGFTITDLGLDIGTQDFFGGSNLIGDHQDIGCAENLSGSGSLPVSWAGFSAVALGEKTALLTWETIGEEDLARFVVEGSADGRDFTAIGELAAANTANTYTFIDDDASSPLSYYRVVAIDFDGKENHSVIREVTWQVGNKQEVKVSPNPMSGTDLTVAWMSPKEENVGWCIYNTYGQEINKGNVGANAGANEVRLALSNLPAGIYLLRLQGYNWDWSGGILQR
ncbi:carbohydrate binding domain-containing protein [Neolewinella aurantiaca]|uniref:carbohydrate binding domain-containing protein n=1 Tax=Neolewinella aurantiaca TaxID=2602767 RepID=UPI001C9CF5B8|nr:carbohydrate binding domain-containing protein [Neolewinella aurantiaca]